MLTFFLPHLLLISYFPLTALHTCREYLRIRGASGQVIQAVRITKVLNRRMARDAG